MLLSLSLSSALNRAALSVLPDVLICAGGGPAGGCCACRLAVNSSRLTVPSLLVSSASNTSLLLALLPALVSPALSSALLIAPSPSLSSELSRSSATSVAGCMGGGGGGVMAASSSVSRLSSSLLSRSLKALLRLTVTPSLLSDDRAELSSSLLMLPSPSVSSFANSSSWNFLLLVADVLLVELV